MPVSSPLIGSWQITSSQLTLPDGSIVEPLGRNPQGFLVFSESGIFAETMVKPDLPRLPDDRTGGTLEDYQALAMGSVGNSGTFTVTEQGIFKSLSIIAGTYPNFIGRTFSDPELRFEVSASGKEINETMTLAPEMIIRVFWKRVDDASSLIAV